MKFEEQGMSLWYGTTDAPAPGETVQDTTEVSITVGVQPISASNGVAIVYRINQGPIETVAARWLRNDPARKAQYFRAILPAFRAGDKVEYVATCRCGGRQIPSLEASEQLPSSFQVAAVGTPTPEVPAGGTEAPEPGPGATFSGMSLPPKVALQPIIPKTASPVPPPTAETGIQAPFFPPRPAAQVTGRPLPSPSADAAVKTPQMLGQLLRDDTKALLTGFTVRAFDAATGKEIETLNNGSGVFGIRDAPPSGTTGRPAQAPAGPRLRLQVVDSQGKEIYRTEVARPVDGDILRVLVPAASLPSTGPSLADAQRVLGNLLPQGALNVLRRAGVTTLGDLARVDTKSVTGADPETMMGLRALKRLSTLTPDLNAAGRLVTAGYRDPLAVAKAAPSDIAKALGVDANSTTVPQVQAAARAQMLWLEKIASDRRLANPQLRASLTALPAFARDDECKCEDCLSAVSPLAYLADLLDFTTSDVFEFIPDIPPFPVDLDWLQNNFCQPFGELLISCADVSRQVHQVRICIEVLRCHLRALPPPQKQQTDLAAAEKAYRLDTYRHLLQRQGASLDEVRLATHADAGVRQQLADRFGIELGSTRPDHLDALALDATTTLTEDALETLFGLVDTTRYPLSDGVTRNDAKGQIRRWNAENVAFGRHTDADGIAYLALTLVVNQYRRIDLYRDKAASQLIASGDDSSMSDVVQLRAQNGGLFDSRIEINYQADATGIELQLFPKLVAWRLGHLRTVWAEADRPPNPFMDLPADVAPIDRLPIIDPDVIGVDDLRYPYPAQAGAPDGAFDIWLRRRQWVDGQLDKLRLLTKQITSPSGSVQFVPDFNLLLKAMLQPVQYGQNTPVPVFVPPISIADLDRIQRDLERPDTAAAARDRIMRCLRLDLTAFARLMELRQRDRQGEMLMADEWEEVFSILVQAQKQALIQPDPTSATREPDWLKEERLLNVDLGPDVFWISATEPKPGAWPPAVGASPLIDPSLKRIDLPDDVAGRRAVALWRARQQELQAFTEQLQDTQIAQPDAGLEPLLVLAFGSAPLSGWVATLDAFYAQWSGGTDPKATEQAIQDQMHLDIETFLRLVTLADRAKPGAKGPPLAPSEWEEVYAILTTVAKIGQKYLAWAAEEKQFGFDKEPWRALKAALPEWRASPGTRQSWQQALRDRSAAPIIDPDQFALEDFIFPDPHDPAFTLYDARLNWLNAEASFLGTFATTVTPTLDPFEYLMVTALFAEADDTNAAIAPLEAELDRDRLTAGGTGFDALLRQVFGPELPNFGDLLAKYNDPATRDVALRTITETLYLTPTALGTLVGLIASASPTAGDVSRFESILAFTILTRCVIGLVASDQAGEDITPSLDQLGLTYEAFDRLVQLRRLAAIDAMDDDDWSVAVSILTRSRKQRRFAIWRDEEKGANIVAGPDYFRVPPVDLLQFPPPPPPPRDEWRFDQQARNRWDETLSSRIDEQQSVIDAMANVVSATEEVTLPVLRDALIKATGLPGSLADQQRLITRRYQIDAAAGGCQMTTRVSQAIRTLQGFLFGLRNGDLRANFPTVWIFDLEFDAKWNWIGSYSTWRAAMFVFLYPENLLAPTLLKHQSPGFQALIEASRAPGGLTPEDACKAVMAYAAYFRDLFFLKPVATCQTRTPPPPGSCQSRQPAGDRFLVYTFALTDDHQRLYWMTYDPDADEEVDGWRHLKAVNNVIEVLGAVPAMSPSGIRYITLAYFRLREQNVELCVIRYNLSPGAPPPQWDSDVAVLPLPSLQQRGNVVLRQMQSEGNSLHFAVQDAATRDIFDNYLHLDHMTWYRDYWVPIARPIASRFAKDVYPVEGDLVALAESNYGFWLILQHKAKTFVRVIGPYHIPVFRLGATTTVGSFLYTISIPERESAVSQYGFVYDTVPFYVSNIAFSGMLEYKRYHNPDYTDRQCTTGDPIADSQVEPNWTYEATLGFVKRGGKHDPREICTCRDTYIDPQHPLPPYENSWERHAYTVSDAEIKGGYLAGTCSYSSGEFAAAGNDSTWWITIDAAYKAVRIISPQEVYIVDAGNNWHQLAKPPVAKQPDPVFVPGPALLNPIAPHSGGPVGSAKPQKHWLGGLLDFFFGGQRPFGAFLVSITKTADGFNSTVVQESFTDIDFAICSLDPTDLRPGLSSSDLQMRRTDAALTGSTTRGGDWNRVPPRGLLLRPNSAGAAASGKRPDRSSARLSADGLRLDSRGREPQNLFRSYCRGTLAELYASGGLAARSAQSACDSIYAWLRLYPVHAAVPDPHAGGGC